MDQIIVYTYNGKILIVDNKIAISDECCCDESETIPIQP
jgi:hypothetical protein